MKYLDIPFDDRRRRYLVFKTNDLPDRLALASTTTTQAFEAVASSRFYVSADHKILAKVVPDKFNNQQAPLKWLLRDYIEKRWLGQSDARKEYLCLKILRSAGLTTPHCHGWGISLNPGNRNASLLLMEHMREAKPGGEVFDALDEGGRRSFLKHLCIEVTQLARHGYIHRDLHYNNFLIGSNHEIVWIDAHIKRLPHKKSNQWMAIKDSLRTNKLRGTRYQTLAEDCIHNLWNENFKHEK